MSYFRLEDSVQIVNDRMGPDTPERLREIMSALVKHLHAFTKEVTLTQKEWEVAIDFLTRTGQICTDERQEFILLSDTLGLSMLVDAVDNPKPGNATESTVLGPFYVAGAPDLDAGANISLDGKGDSCLFSGRVLDLEGNPIEGALVDVWSDNSDGYYDVQQPGIQPKWNNRGRFRTDAQGRYSFRGIKPVSYPIPDDGPVGQMLGALGRHPNRPAHMHYIVSAPNFRRLVTHTFVGNDPWLESDAVFGAKRTLIAPYEPVRDGTTLWHSPFDFVLVPEAAQPATACAPRRETALITDGE